MPELRNEQREWIKERDLSCLEPEKAVEAGTTRIQCLAAMTEQRAIKLENMNVPSASVNDGSQ